MANRYWVGGNGTWNLTATTNWSATSNGASGASAPTPGDDVYFDVNSNSGTGNWTVTLVTGTCASLNVSGLDGQLTINLGTLYTNTLTVYGSINVAIATTVTNLYYSSTSPNWASTLSNYFTTTNFIKIGMTSTSLRSIVTGTTITKILGSLNIGEAPVITTVTTITKVLGSLNIGEAPVITTFVSTTLPFISNNPLMLRDTPTVAFDLFGESYSSSIKQTPYQFWG
jgi:hypothetical protein